MDPADVETVPAPDQLRPFVRRYVYANQRLQSPLVLRPKPTGYTYFANFFRKSSGYFAMVDGQRVPFNLRWHLPGQIVDHDIAVHYPDTHEALYCELAATALHRLFGVPGDKTTGKAPPLSEIEAGFEALARKHFVLGPEGTRDQHAGEANAFFLRLAERAGPGDQIVEAAVALFEAANGAVRVADVCEQLGADPRHLHRRFTHIVGVNPNSSDRPCRSTGWWACSTSTTPRR